MFETISTGEVKTVVIEENESTYIRLIPEVSGTYTFISISYADTYGYLYDADKSWLADDNDSETGRNFLITYDLIAETVYYFGVRYYGNQNGAFDVKLIHNDSQHKHYYVSQITTLAICAENGHVTYTCDICGDNYVKEIIVVGHSEVVESAVAATYEASELTDGKYCSVCSEVLTAQEVVPALGSQLCRNQKDRE